MTYLTNEQLAELEAIRAQMPDLELMGGFSDKPVNGEFDYGITAITGGHSRVIAEVFGKVGHGLPMPANVIGANFIAAVHALPALLAEVQDRRALAAEQEPAVAPERRWEHITVTVRDGASFRTSSVDKATREAVLTSDHPNHFLKLLGELSVLGWEYLGLHPCEIATGIFRRPVAEAPAVPAAAPDAELVAKAAVAIALLQTHLQYMHTPDSDLGRRTQHCIADLRIATGLELPGGASE